MKRKVKFQEGGMVETPSQRRVRLSESFRDRDAEFRDRVRQAARERMAQRRLYGSPSATAEVNRFNERMNRAMPITPEEARSLGAEPAQRPANPRPNVSQRLQAEALRPPTSGPAGSAARARLGGGVLGAGAALGAGLAGPLVDYGRDFAARRGAEADARRELNLRSMGARTADAEGGDIAAAAERQRQEANRTATSARPRPVEMGEGPAATMARLRAEQRQREMSEADMLNAREFQRILAERAAEERQASRMQRVEDMGGSGNIGAASARERGEQVGPPGQYNMKRGGKVPAPKAVVKKKAGGMIAAKPKAAPKKMMKGGIVAKPKSKAKPMAKSMPAFKKGGVIKKGRK